MRLEILHVPDCPHVAVLRERLYEALGDTTADVTVRLIDNLTKAAAAGMTGSPTLLIDGVDPFAQPGQTPSVSCRLYRDDRAPTVEQLRHALSGKNTDCCEPGASLRNTRARTAPFEPRCV